MGVFFQIMNLLGQSHHVLTLLLGETYTLFHAVLFGGGQWPVATLSQHVSYTEVFFAAGR